MSVSNNNNVHKSLQKSLDVANYTVSTVEPLEKITKITSKVIDLLQGLTGRVSEPFKLFSGQLKNTVDLFEGMNFIGRIKELACPDEQGRYFFKKSSLQKCVDRIFLTASSFFKMINAGIKLGIVNLGYIARITIGRIPLLRLLPDSLVAISSSFSVWDNAEVSSRAKSKLEKASQKAEKWAQRSNLIEQIRNGNLNEINNLKIHYQGRLIAIEKQITNANANPDTIAKMKIAYEKYQDRFNKICIQDYAGLADDLAKQNIDFKQKKWSVELNNQKIAHTKARMGITSAISKICIISIATTLTALNCLSLPFAMSLLAMGIVVDSIGYTKTVYEYTVKPQELPKAPSLSV